MRWTCCSVSLLLIGWMGSLGCASDDASSDEGTGGGSITGSGGSGYVPDKGSGGRGPSPVLEACIPPSEESSEYPGAALAEISLETTENCASGLCLVHHFQGRVTCPYGQNQEDIDGLAPDDPARCRLPFQSGESESQTVAVPVPPQFTGRPASDAVYCSCRCAGPDPDAEYCACPSGSDCLELLEDTGGASSQYAGAYCVKSGTEFDPTRSYGAPCGSGAPDEALACGERNP